MLGKLVVVVFEGLMSAFTCGEGVGGRDFRPGVELGTFHVPMPAVAGPDG